MGNNLTYRTHDPDQFAPRVEEIVRKDLGQALAVRYSVEQTGVKSSFATDVARLAVGSDLAPLATLDFELPWPGEAHLVAVASRVGMTTVVGMLSYEFDLGRPISSEMRFDKKKGFVTLDGEETSALKKLNDKPDLAKRLGKLLRNETMFGTMTLRVEADCSIVRNGDASRLRIRTLARTTGFLQGSATTDAGEAAAIAREIQAAL